MPALLWLFWEQTIPALAPWFVLYLASLTIASTKTDLGLSSLFVDLVKNGFYAFSGLSCMLSVYWESKKMHFHIPNVLDLCAGGTLLAIAFMFLAGNPILPVAVSGELSRFSYASIFGVFCLSFSFALACMLKILIVRQSERDKS